MRKICASFGLALCLGARVVIPEACAQTNHDFVGLPTFSDPAWETDSGYVGSMKCDAATFDYANFVNDQGTPSVQLRTTAAGHGSDLFIYPTNTYYPLGSTNVTGHYFGFWCYSQALSLSDYIYVNIGPNEAFPTITSSLGTNSGWRYYQYQIAPSQSGQQLRIMLTTADSNPSVYADIDGCEYLPILPPSTTTGPLDTNFMVSPIGGHKLQFAWSQINYTNYWLISSSNFANWSRVTNTTTVSNGYVVMTVQEDPSAQRLFYRLEW